MVNLTVQRGPRSGRLCKLVVNRFHQQMKGRGKIIAAQVQESGSKREHRSQTPQGGPSPGSRTPGVKESPAPQPLAVPIPKVLSRGTEQPNGMPCLGHGADRPWGSMGILGRGAGVGTTGPWKRRHGEVT